MISWSYISVNLHKDKAEYTRFLHTHFLWLKWRSVAKILPMRGMKPGGSRLGPTINSRERPSALAPSRLGETHLPALRITSYNNHS